ncbi:MAG TPA: ribonuclease HII [Candidatus Saccharimonadales bacterium]|nr:ribonuclease HII [Candidatus Saccharimonadales bacterium]
MIVGIDEVGRGCLAGPVCVAAVLMPEKFKMKGLADSKKVLRGDRAELVLRIRKKAQQIAIGWASPSEIDEFNIWKAVQLAAARAISQLDIPSGTLIVVDGNARMLGEMAASYVVKADDKYPAVMAASNVAKLARDNYMAKIDHIYEGFNFASHVGYGTKKHRESLALLGPTDIHRFSYGPVKEFAV